MIVLVGGQKGGTGKSTVSTNLAAWVAGQGKDVLLVDANPQQGTSRNWAARREEDDSLKRVACVEKRGNLYNDIRDLAQRYDEIIIDTGGQDSRELRTAMPVCNVLITPVRPSQTDIETTVYMSEMASEVQEVLNPEMQALVLITQAPPHPKIALVSEAKEILKDLETDFMRLAQTVIYHRKVYVDAMPAGMGVCELKNPKAIDEIESLVKEIYQI